MGLTLNLIMITYFSGIIIAMGFNVYRNYHRFRSFNREDIQTLFTMIIFLIISLIITISIHRIDSRQYGGTDSAMYLFIIFGAGPIAMIIVLLITNLIKNIAQYPKVLRHGYELALGPQTPQVIRKLDWARKAFHISTFVLLATLMMVFFKYFSAAYHWSILDFWGSYDGSTIIIQLYSTELPFTIGQLVGIGVFYNASCISLILEATRLSDHVHFPLVGQIQRTLRKKEINTFASHTHIAVGYFFAALILPPNCLLAALCLFSLGDTFAAIIGINFGKHRYTFNKKSIEGTVAGFLVSLLVAYLFVGWVWALISAIVFVIIDLLTPQLIKISDNILIPIIMVGVYYGLHLLAIPATFPMADFILSL